MVLRKFSAFVFVLLGSKSSMVYIIFRTPKKIFVVTPPIYTLHVDTPLSSMPPMQFTWHFRWRKTYVLFTLGKICSSRFTTPATYAAFLQENNQCLVYFRKQVHILSCHTRNICDRLKGSSSQYLTVVIVIYDDFVAKLKTCVISYSCRGVGKYTHTHTLTHTYIYIYILCTCRLNYTNIK